MNDATDNGRIALAFACILIVWGTTYLGTAILLRDVPPFTTAAMRCTLAALVMYALLRQRAPRPLAGLPAARVATSGVLMCAMGSGLTVFAMQGVSSGTAALINATIPLCVALLDWGFFNRRRPRVWTGIGLVVAMAGVALLVEQTTAVSGGGSLGYLLCLAVAVTAWSWGTLMQRHAVPRERLLALGCGQLGAGAAALWLAGGLTGEWVRLDLAAVSPIAWASLLYLALVGSVVAQSAYLWLLTRWPAEKVTTYAVANPVIALVLGAMVLGETVTASGAAGAVLVLGGVALVLFEHRATAAVKRLLQPRR